MPVVVYAIHLDEPTGTPHLHLTTSAQYTDKNGVLCPCSAENALLMANVALPKPDNKNSRYNNRQMTFTDECRKKFQEIGMKHGFNIENVPKHVREGTDPDKHLSIPNYKATQDAKHAKEEAEIAIQQAKEREQVAEIAIQQAEKREAEAEIAIQQAEKREREAATAKRYADNDKSDYIKLCNETRQEKSKLRERSEEYNQKLDAWLHDLAKNNVERFNDVAKQEARKLNAEVSKNLSAIQAAARQQSFDETLRKYNASTDYIAAEIKETQPTLNI
jgi:hypothetical protein